MEYIVRELREYLKRRDPQGYYVIPAKPEAIELLGSWKGILLETSGETVLVRVKSRSLARKVVLTLSEKNLLA